MAHGVLLSDKVCQPPLLLKHLSPSDLTMSSDRMTLVRYLLNIIERVVICEGQFLEVSVIRDQEEVTGSRNVFIVQWM